MVEVIYEALKCEYGEDEILRYKGYTLYKTCTKCKKNKTIQIKPNGWSYETCKDCRLKAKFKRMHKNKTTDILFYI